jgi:hypothetical protein
MTQQLQEEDELEECASAVVCTIQSVVASIRLAFQPLQASRSREESLQKVDLYACFQASGVTEQMLKMIELLKNKLGITIILNPIETIPRETNQQTLVADAVLLPLLGCLYECYTKLDAIPQPTPSTISKKKAKPPPPKGMLSIQNYTDIAALLEFSVCTSILPNLDPLVLPTARDRAQMLPKSLAGRLPRISLLWANSNHALVSDSSRVSQLIDTAKAVAQVTLLDRFRPMLLPRHASDLFAAVLQAQELGISEQTGLLLQMLSTIDTIHQAKALQTLLLAGTKAPLKRLASQRLTQLASVDLSAIVEVFCTSAKDPTSAAARLAKVLPADDVSIQNQLVLLLTEAHSTSVPFTVWAVLEQHQRVVPMFLDVLTRNVSSDTLAPHGIVQKLQVLLSVVSDATSRSVVTALFLPYTATLGMNLMSLLVRLASMDSLEDTRLHRDAINVLRKVSTVLETDLAPLALLHAMSHNSWDLHGNRWKLAINTPQGLVNVELVRDDMINENVLLAAVERRVRCIVNHVVAFGSEQSEKDVLSYSLFQHCLLAIFALSSRMEIISGSPWYRMTVMVTLPLLCETFSPESLLFGPWADSCGMLSTFVLILDCGAMGDSMQQSNQEISLQLQQFSRTQDRFAVLTKSGAGSPVSESEPNDRQDLEQMLLSTMSIVLSLLTVMLELGSGKRSSQEMALLNSMLSALEVLSSVETDAKMHGIDMKRLRGEIAEMASHAAAMIASLDKLEFTSDTSISIDEEPGESITKCIEEAEQELQSKHPAIRAHGVVRLRHLAQGYLAQRSGRDASRHLIIDVSVPDSGNAKALHEILRVSAQALKDQESYVYLAGIQTIVAVADGDPRLTIPILARAIVSGDLILSRGVSKLCENERIKLAEALLFVVRRRGHAIDNYASEILGALLFGSRHIGGDQSVHHSKLMQQQAHDYFMTDQEDTNELTQSSGLIDAKELRINTGGPVFEIEANDVLRSSCIAVVSEVVSVSSAFCVAPYAASIVRLVTNALNLDNSRPVRRASAFLALSSYIASLKELEQPSNASWLTIALVQANEEAMKSSLEYSMTVDETRNHRYDPAVTARCHEALEARRELEHTGALTAAALYIDAKKREDPNHAVELVKRRLNEKTALDDH